MGSGASDELMGQTKPRLATGVPNAMVRCEFISGEANSHRVLSDYLLYDATVNISKTFLATLVEIRQQLVIDA